MMTITIKRYKWGKLAIRTDFARPETMIEFAADEQIEAGDFHSTPFQASMAFKHGAPDEARALRLVNDWLRGECDV